MKPNSYDSHFVPNAYLKKFVNSKRTVFLVKKNAPERLRLNAVSPKSICKQRDFYKFSDKHALQGRLITDPNFLEERGFLYENRLGKWIDMAISPLQLMSFQDAYDLASSLFNLKVRNPYYREHSYSSQNIGASIDNILADQQYKRESGQSIGPLQGIPQELIEKVTESIRHEWTTNADIAKELHNRTLLENNYNPSLIRQWVYHKLATARWIVFKTTIGHPFICSDNPGYCLDENEGIHNIKFGGRCTFVIPLTSYHTLAIKIEDDAIRARTEVKTIERFDAPPEIVKGINHATWLVARKEVYAAQEYPLLQMQRIANGSGLIL